MNKSELVLEIQSKLGEGATKACAERALEAVLDSFKAAIKKDGAVQLVGFGSFSVTERKARQGVNPQNLVYIPVTTVPINDAETGNKLIKLVERLDELEDVKEVYTNYELDPSLHLDEE